MMGTKREPGQFDCWAKAEPDEPLFVLLGRDPVAAPLVELWACLRSHNWVGAARAFWLCHQHAERLPAERIAKTAEAAKCAEAMQKWAWLARRSSAPEALQFGGGDG